MGNWVIQYWNINFSKLTFFILYFLFLPTGLSTCLLPDMSRFESRNVLNMARRACRHGGTFWWNIYEKLNIYYNRSSITLYHFTNIRSSAEPNGQYLLLDVAKGGSTALQENPWINLTGFYLTEDLIKLQKLDKFSSLVVINFFIHGWSRSQNYEFANVSLVHVLYHNFLSFCLGKQGVSVTVLLDPDDYQSLKLLMNFL